MTKQQIVKAAKLTILARFFIKKDGTSNGVFYKKGSVVCLVRNGEGREYYTTLRPNKIHSCTCPATKTCYHIEVCKTTTNARNAERIAEKARLEQEIESILAQARTYIARKERTVTNVERTLSAAGFMR